MNNQSAPYWVSFSRRSIEIKQKIEEVFRSCASKDTSPSAEDLYDDMSWGVLQQADLYRGLNESLRQKKCLSADEMKIFIPQSISAELQPGYSEDEYDDTTLVDLVPNDVEGKSLSWFVAHPPSKEIGDMASDRLDQRILDLYVTHVNETGETYFPQLESQLRAYYEMLANQ